MSHLHLRRLCRPEILRKIDVRLLDRLLAPHRTYLATRGVALPLESPTNTDALTQLFTTPDSKMPSELIDALYFIDDLATPSGLEALRAQTAGLSLWDHGEPAPADVALRVWLHDRNVVERVHAELAVRRLRAFRFFRTTTPATTIQDLDVRFDALAEELRGCFAQRGRGRYARIITSRQDDSMWLYVAHGAVMRRDGAVEQARPASICYRPEVYDALVYNTATGELGIHARSEWERTLYQRMLGKHLFDNEGMFVANPRYTLQPLWTYGRDALRSGDMPGIDFVTLVQLTVYQHGRCPRTETYRADNLFRSWGIDELPFDEGVRLVAAGFRVHLRSLNRPRLVVLRPPNQAQFSRDVDRAVVEQWLADRGFLAGETEHADAHALLAVA
jgi:hypothetical protein